jgi:hypothetical protein
MIRHDGKKELNPEPQEGRPVQSAEAWLGRNRRGKRQLWERLNPRHRKELRLLAEALALEQTKGRLPESARMRLATALEELERVVRRIAAILTEVARRTPPSG